MRIFALIIIVLGSGFTYSMTPEQVLEKIRSTYKSIESIEYKVTYELFKGHKSSEIHSSYDGYVYRSGRQLYQKINQSELVYGTGYFLKISHGEKAMVLDLEAQQINAEVNISTVLNELKDVQLKDGRDSYTLLIRYKVSAQSPFSLVKMQVNKKSFRVEQLDFYYANQQDFSKSYKVKDYAQPHLRMTFSNTNTKPKEKAEYFNFSKYIEQRNNILIPTGKCSGYELIDNRVK